MSRIECDDVELRCMVVAAVRYSFRRLTYMPSTIAGIVAKNIDRIDPGTASILARDIRSEMGIDANLEDNDRWPRMDACWVSMLPMLDERAGAAR